MSRLFKAHGRFTTVPNDTARNANLSRAARGLLVELTSHADGYEISLAGIIDGGPEGRHAVNTMIEDLERAGYLFRARRVGDDGRLASYQWLVSTLPITADDVRAWVKRTGFKFPADVLSKYGLEQSAENLSSENQTSENLSSENQHSYKEDQTTKEYQEEEENQRARRDDSDEGTVERQSGSGWADVFGLELLDAGAERLDRFVFMSEWKHRTGFKLWADDNRTQALDGICKYFDAPAIREAIDFTSSYRTADAYGLFLVYLKREAFTRAHPDVDIIGLKEFLRQYSEALDKPWDLNQTTRLTGVVLEHTADEITSALAQTHFADRPCFKYFYKVLAGIREAREK